MTFPQNGPSRSTPIPGNPLDAPPPTPSQFLGGQQPFAAPPSPGFGAPQDAGQVPPQFGVPQPFGVPQLGTSFPVPPTRRRRGIGFVLLWLVILAGPIAGVAIGVWAVFKAKDAVERADDLSDPALSAADRKALGVSSDVTTLFEPGAAPALVAVFEDALAGEPTRFEQISFYSDYAFATVQDPAAPTHLDRYQWRSAEVGSPTPELNVSDVESSLFSLSDVDWDAIAVLTAQAPAITQVESGAVTHVIVDRTVFDAALPVVIRVYVSGPRGSAFVEADAQGNVTAVH